jgi:hypothetical protein
MIGVKADDFSWVSGRDEIQRYEAPVEKRPPGFRTAFCRRCGSPMPSFEAADDWFEVAAGILDDDPGLRPDRHIFIDCGSAWYEILDDLPQLTESDVVRMRIAAYERSAKQQGENS